MAHSNAGLESTLARNQETAYISEIRVAPAAVPCTNHHVVIAKEQITCQWACWRRRWKWWWTERAGRWIERAGRWIGRAGRWTERAGRWTERAGRWTERADRWNGGWQRRLCSAPQGWLLCQHMHVLHGAIKFCKVVSTCEQRCTCATYFAQLCGQRCATSSQSFQQTTLRRQAQPTKVVGAACRMLI